MGEQAGAREAARDAASVEAGVEAGVGARFGPWGRARSEAGAAALELALMLPFLSLLLIGLVDFARHAAAARVAAAAAERAAVTARLIPASGEGPTVAESAAAGQPVARTRRFAGCPGRRGIVPAQGGRCPGGARAIPFVEVRVDAQVEPLVPWPEALLPGWVSARAIVPLG